MSIIFQYLECPTYLRKSIFPICSELRHCGLLKDMDLHYHLLPDKDTKYREGLTLDRPSKKNCGSWIELGIKKQGQLDIKLEPKVRVTVKINDDCSWDSSSSIEKL